MRLGKSLIIKLILTVVLVAGSLGLSPRGAMALSNNGAVRVGVYELEGFHSFKADGTAIGYDVDYLNRIANTTGWKYEFVKANSWQAAIAMLRNKQIDLLAPSQITPDRLQDFSFSSFPIGKVYAAILTNEWDNTVYEDYEAFNKMTFGIEQGNTYAQIFQDYAKNRGFTPQIRYYANHEQLVDGLRKGQVNAIVCNVMRAEPGTKLLGKAGTAQFYYMYRREDLALGDALDQALDQIEIDEPDFQDELTRSYFPIYTKDPFSKAELDYAHRLPKVRVAACRYNSPFTYIDTNTGQLTGIIIEFLRQSGKLVGIEYEFIPGEGIIDEEFIRTNKINLVVDAGLTPMEKNHSLAVYTNNFLATQQMLVVGPEVQFSLNKELTIGTHDDRALGDANFSKRFPSFKWINYADNEESIEAVRSGKVDGTLMNQYAANRLLTRPRYEDLRIVPNSMVAQTFCLRGALATEGVNPKDPMLMAVLNKSFKQIDKAKEQQLVMEFTSQRPYELSFLEICYKYRAVIVLIAIVLLVVLGGLSSYAYRRKREAALDGLTGLANRNSARATINSLLKGNSHQAGALILLDLDHFKEVNDTLGHQTGDALLIDTANIIKGACRSNDVTCRLGGDEMMLYLPCNDPASFLPAKLEELRSKLERTLGDQDQSIRVTCSMGVALFPTDGTDIKSLYQHADEALYRVKANGRNGFEFYSRL